MNIAIPHCRWVLAVAVLCLVLIGGVKSVAQEAVAAADSVKLGTDFQNRAKQYLDLRKKVAGKSPKQSDSPTGIAANQKVLGERIRDARSGAKQGEIFTPELTTYFRRKIAASLTGPHGNGVRASLRHADPVNVKLQVNQTYPENVPLQSTPPSLLLNLPSLPEGLEYRIVGRDLVLRDTEANIVVDFIPDAVS